MSSTSTALSFIIGGTVGASFGKAISTSTKSISDLRKKAEQESIKLSDAVSMRKVNLSGFGKLRRESADLGKAVTASRQRTTALGKSLASIERDAKKTGLPSLSIEAKKLRAEFERSRRETESLTRRWQTASSAANAMRTQLRSTRNEHKSSQEAIRRHREELGRLSAVEAGRKKIGQGVSQLAAGGAILATTKSLLGSPVMQSADYQATIRDMAIKGGIARSLQESSISRMILGDAKSSGIGADELAQAVNALVTGGMNVNDAAGMARTMARFSVGQQSDSGDVAKMVLALRQAGIADAGTMERVLGKIAVAGDLGSFEARDMAKHFSSLLPQMTAFGMSGEDAAISLANMLQTQMKAAGSADEAAVNLANLLSKIVSNDSQSRFAKQGINLNGSMMKAIVKGYDPVSAFLGIVQKATKETDPKKAEELASLQERIANAQDPAAAQKMLDGYLEMAGLSEFVADRQARQAALAAIQNRKLHEENLKTIQSTDGLAKIEKDLADRRAASGKIWSEAGNAFNRIMISLGDALRPVTDLIGQAVTSVIGMGESILNTSIGQGAAVAGMGAAAGAGVLMAGRGIKNIGGGALRILRGRMPISTGSGMATRAAQMLGGAVDGGLGALGVQKVFVVNMPGAGLPGGAGGAGGGKGTGGFFSRAKAATSGALGSIVGAGQAALSAPTLGAIASGGAGTVAAAGGLVAASGAAGYGIGTLINAGIDKALSAATGRETSLGSWLYDKFHPSESAVAAKSKPDTAAQPQEISFAPTVQVTVQGDVKDPRQLANDLMPHIRRLFDQFNAKTARAALYDASYH